MTKNINVLQRQYDRMRDELEQVNSRHGMELAKVEAAYQERIRFVERERDAAVRDLCDIASNSFPCDLCARDSRSCGEDVVFCKAFKWRGICVENGGTEE